MAPWLESGMIRISDAETPFLAELRKELDLYPFCKYDDALDALYWACRGMPDVLVVEEDEEDELPSIERRRKEKEKYRSPFLALGAK